MWTAIWTVLVFVLLLFHGDTIVVFAAEQLRDRLTHRLQVEHERTKQALIARQRDALIWDQLDNTTDTTSSTEQVPEPHWTQPTQTPSGRAPASPWPAATAAPSDPTENPAAVPLPRSRIEAVSDSHRLAPNGAWAAGWLVALPP
jgi:hypothetical protein